MIFLIIALVIVLCYAPAIPVTRYLYKKSYIGDGDVAFFVIFFPLIFPTFIFGCFFAWILEKITGAITGDTYR